MAVRFVNPISTPYESQFVPLPIEYMAKNLEAKQKAFDEAVAKTSSEVFDLSDVPWATNANVLAQPYQQKRDEILKGLQQSGNVNQALMSVNQLKKDWLKDKRVQQQLDFIENYELYKPVFKKDPDLLITGWDPNFMQEPGQWTKRDWATQAGEFDALSGEQPSLIKNESIKYLRENVGENLKGTLVGKGGVTDIVWEPSMQKWAVKKGQTVDHYIDFNNPNDPYTQKAIDSWTDLILNPETGRDAHQRYIREGTFGKVTDPALKKEKIKDLIWKALSPYYTSKTEQTEDISFVDQGGGGGSDSDTELLPFGIQELLIQGNLSPAAKTSLTTYVTDLNKQAVELENQSATEILNMYKSDPEFISLLSNYVPPGVDLSKVSKVTTKELNDAIAFANSQSTKINVQKDPRGNIISARNVRETLMDDLVNFATRKLSNLKGQDPATLTNEQLAQMSRLQKSIDSYATAAEGRENITEAIGIISKDKAEFDVEFINQFDNYMGVAANDWTPPNASAEWFKQTPVGKGARYTADKARRMYKGSMANRLKGGLFGYFSDEKDLKEYLDQTFKGDEEGKRKFISDAISGTYSYDVGYDDFILNTLKGNTAALKFEAANRKIQEMYNTFYNFKDPASDVINSRTAFELVNVSPTVEKPLKHQEAIYNWVNDAVTNNDALSLLLGDDFDPTKDVGSQMAKVLEKNPHAVLSVDGGFDLTKFSFVNSEKNKVEKVLFDTDLRKGPSLIVTYGQKGTDGSVSRMKVSIPMNSSLQQSFKSDILAPMIESPDTRTSEVGLQMLVDMEIDSKEKALIRSFIGYKGSAGDVISAPVTINTSLGKMEYELIKSGSDEILLRSIADKSKVYSVSNDFETIMRTFGQLLKTQLNTVPSGGSGGSSGKKQMTGFTTVK